MWMQIDIGALDPDFYVARHTVDYEPFIKSQLT